MPQTCRQWQLRSRPSRRIGRSRPHASVPHWKGTAHACCCAAQRCPTQVTRAAASRGRCCPGCCCCCRCCRQKWPLTICRPSAAGQETSGLNSFSTAAAVLSGNLRAAWGAGRVGACPGQGRQNDPPDRDSITGACLACKSSIWTCLNKLSFARSQLTHHVAGSRIQLACVAGGGARPGCVQGLAGQLPATCQHLGGIDVQPLRVCRCEKAGKEPWLRRRLDDAMAKVCKRQAALATLFGPLLQQAVFSFWGGGRACFPGPLKGLPTFKGCLAVTVCAPQPAHQLGSDVLWAAGRGSGPRNQGCGNEANTS